MFLWRKKIQPGQIIIVGFALTILAGTLLLMLPIASRHGRGTEFLDALFTSTSAVCVTGLVVFDTFTHWSMFGQLVILLLVQVGGMGVVTMAIAIFMITGKKIGINERFLMQESISAPQMGGIVRMTGFIIKAAALMEGVGALILAARFCPTMGLAKGLWFGIFHSVTAFCNAGFDLMGEGGEFSSLTSYENDPVVNLTIMLLIIIGGIGFFVWNDVKTNLWHFHSYRLQTKLVLVTTVCLLAIPAVLFYFGEFSDSRWGLESFSQRFWASAFQAVTPRTAGFNTVDLGLVSEPALMLIIILMLVGGSPGSTAGGFKTTTLAAMVLSIRTVFRKQERIQCFGRRLPTDILKNAMAIFTLYLILFLTGGVLICVIEDIPLTTALFEAASAIGTVGLTLGLTPTLEAESQIILIFLMYFGRVGGLTMIYALQGSHAPVMAQLPKEKITIG